MQEIQSASNVLHYNAGFLLTEVPSLVDLSQDRPFERKEASN
jgi:hypothetical protein